MNKIIVRNRKPVYTEKRNPYKKYQLAEWLWTDIFKELKLLQLTIKKGYIKIISKKYGINYKTLKNKYCNFLKNGTDIAPLINNENRGGSNKMFTITEEKEIYIYLKSNFIDKNRILCNENIKLHAIDKCKSLYPNKQFTASDGWCTLFKKKWNLSTVNCSVSRISTRIHTNKDINYFLNKCINGQNQVGPKYFFNLDETKWNNINVSLTTIHIKGTSNAKVNINGNEKEGFTLTLIISYSGKMLIPILTAKGKTNNCLKKYDLNDSIIGTYSNNGWTNNGIVKIALEQISKMTKNKKSFLVIDKYSSHTTDFIKNESKNKNIELIYIPEGLTYKYQPLDVLINGILKQKSKKLWRTEITRNPDLKITNKDAVRHFLTAQKEVTKETIKKSFNISCLNLEYVK